MSVYKNLLFIGGGNIAGAVALGLVSSGAVPAEKISVYDIDTSKLEKFSKVGIKTFSALSDAVNDVQYIFLAVKPAIVKTVMQELSNFDGLLDNVVVISFAASVEIDHIEKACDKHIAVIRTMPSTPILVGEGVLAVCRNDKVSSKDFQFFCRMMSSVAHVTVISESLMNPIISVHGSSPAYVYLFVKSMVEAAEKQGIDPEVSLPLILKTVKGSVAMIEKSDVSLEQLISNVASPNGTTLAALNSFSDDDFSGSVERAMLRCTERANEISKEL